MSDRQIKRDKRALKQMEVGKSTGHQSVCDTSYHEKRDLRVCMALKLNRNLDNHIPSKPTKNIIKSEKA